MQIFIISLTDAIQRRSNAKMQLDNIGIEFCFFDALVARHGYSEYFNAYDECQYVINTGRKPTPGEIGCYASHLALWKACLELNKPIMIMEDDFRLNTNFSDALHETQRLIEQYGFIRLQSETRGKTKLVKKTGDFSLVYYKKMPHSLMCYAITPEIARIFIRFSGDLTAPVDVMIKKIWEHKQRLYGLSPYSVLESDHSQVSTIPGRTKHRKSIKMKLIRFYTKISWIVKRIQFTYNFVPPS